MLPEDRRRRILNLLDDSEVLRPADLAARLEVSPETIRRDLVVLEEAGDVRRVYGGVVRARDMSRNAEPRRAEREVLQQEAKADIAALVAGLVGDGDSVFMDVGTTVLAGARALPAGFGGRIITNSVGVVIALADRPGIRLHLAGGRIRHDELTCSGSDTAEQVGNFFADKAFLGSGGVHPEAGLTDYDLDEIAVRRRMIDNASEVYVLADGTKLGHVALRKVCGWDRITALITDAAADPGIVRALRETGLTVLQPPPGTGGPAGAGTP